MWFKCGRKQPTELIYKKLISSSSLAFHLTTHSRGWLVHQYQKIGTTKTSFWLMCHMSFCRKLTLINALEKKGNSPGTQGMTINFSINHKSHLENDMNLHLTNHVKTSIPYVYFTIRNCSCLG